MESGLGFETLWASIEKTSFIAVLDTAFDTNFSISPFFAGKIPSSSVSNKGGEFDQSGPMWIMEGRSQNYNFFEDVLYAQPLPAASEY